MTMSMLTTQHEVPQLVWYDSPFVPAEWMKREQAEAELARDLTRVGPHDRKPRIVEREERVNELKHKVRKEFPHLIDHCRSASRKRARVRS